MKLPVVIFGFIIESWTVIPFNGRWDVFMLKCLVLRLSTDSILLNMSSQILITIWRHCSDHQFRLWVFKNMGWAYESITACQKATCFWRQGFCERHPTSSAVPLCALWCDVILCSQMLLLITSPSFKNESFFVINPVPDSFFQICNAQIAFQSGQISQKWPSRNCMLSDCVLLIRPYTERDHKFT